MSTEYHGITMVGDLETDNIKAKDTNGTTLYDSNDVVCAKSVPAGKFQLKNGTSVNEFSIDGTLAGNSDLAIPTEKAVKTYVDEEIDTVSTSLSDAIDSNTSDISTNANNISSLEGKFKTGTGSFAGGGGTVTVTHDMGTTAHRIFITPNGNPGGNLGEVWCENRTSTTIDVGNSGSYTGGFWWFVVGWFPV